MPNLERITVTNVFGPLNRGDFELFNQLIELIGDARIPEVHAVARDPAGSSRYFPDVVFHSQPGVAAEISGPAGRAIAMIRTIILYLAASFPVLATLLPKAQRTSLAAIRNADLVLACPGGYLTSTSLSFFPQLAQLHYAVRQGKSVWLAPMSIGPAHGFLHRFLLGRTLRLASRIYVRESWSEAFCEALGAPAVRSADLALRPARTWLLNSDRAERKPVCITATIVRWEFPGASNPDEAKQAYADAMSDALNQIAERTKLPVKLLLQVDNDRKVTEQVSAQLTVPHSLVRVDTPEEYRSILRTSHVMIGSRFHSAIFSMSVGCPTLVVSYLPKARFMMEDMGLEQLVHDIETVRAENLMMSYRLLQDPGLELQGKVRDQLLAQTELPRNPFISDFQTVNRAERGEDNAG